MSCYKSGQSKMGGRYSASNYTPEHHHIHHHNLGDLLVDLYNQVAIMMVVGIPENGSKSNSRIKKNLTSSPQSCHLPMSLRLRGFEAVFPLFRFFNSLQCTHVVLHRQPGCQHLSKTWVGASLPTDGHIDQS